MSAQILIVEPLPTRRIALRALLEKARFRVEQCHDAAAARRLMAAGLRPELVLLRAQGHAGRADPSGTLAETIGSLKTRRAAPGIGWLLARPEVGQGTSPLVIAIDEGPAVPDRRAVDAARSASAARLQALVEGADDAISRPFSEPVLLARIRSLLRARAELDDLRPRDTAELVEGFAETAETFDLPQRIVVLAPRCGLAARDDDLSPGLTPALAALSTRRPARFETFAPSADFDAEPGDTRPFPDRDGAEAPEWVGAGRPAPDLIIIDPAIGAPDGMVAGDIFRLIADLRSRSPLRQAEQLLILPADSPDLATLALDLGVDDIVSEDVGPGELSHRIETLLRKKKIADGMRASVRRGLEAAVIDPLTGLHNRRYAMPHLAMLAGEAGARQRPFAVMMLDIDHFKRINDTFGHTTGDCVLRRLARRLKSELRPRDLVARIGGEEFLVVLPETTEADAREVAERLRRSVAVRPFDGNEVDCALPQDARRRIEVTISVGVALGGAGHPCDSGAADLFDRADRALFAAKEAGRNTVTLSASAA